MNKNRLEAFTDATLAIILTITVLELKIPHDPTWESFQELVPTLLIYLLSFISIAIYWINHHHLFQVVKKVNGSVLWANLAMLFWLSLLPFVTIWMGENHLEKVPVTIYGIVVLFAALSYGAMVACISAVDKDNSALKKVLDADQKGKITSLIYLIAVGLSFWNSWIALALYAGVAIVWLIPDRRFEQVFATSVQS